MKDYIILEFEKNNIFKNNSNKIKNHILKIVENELYLVKNKENYFKALKTSLDLYYENIDLLKKYTKLDKDSEYYFNILDKHITNLYYPEYLSDKIVKISEYNDVVKYSKSFLRSYSYLMNNETIEKFRFIKSKNIKREYIQDNLRKIASFNSSEDLNSALSKIIDNIKITKNEIIKKIKEKNLDAEIAFQNDDKLIVKINDYDASKELGSSQWCISYNEDYYYEYLNYDNTQISDLNNYDDCYDSKNIEQNYINTYIEGNHFFVWDFKKDSDDSESLIAFTLKPNGTISDAHDKNDKSLFSFSDSAFLLTDSCIINSIKNTIYENQERSKDLIERSDILDNPIHLLHNSPFPLVTYYELLKKMNKTEIKDFIFRVNQINIPKKIIELTEKNYEDFGYNKKTDIVKSFIWFADYIDYVKKIEQKISEKNDFENEYCDDEFDNDEDEKFEFNIYFDNKKEILKNDFIYKVINDMNENERFLLFKNKKIINLIEERAKIETYQNDEFILTLFQNYKYFENIKFRNYDFDDLRRISLKINISKLKEKFEKIQTLDEKESISMANMINNNSNYIESLNLKSIDNIINIINNNIFINNLKERTMDLIVKKIEKETEIKVVFDKIKVKKLESNRLEEEGLGCIINKMYRLGFASKKFIDSIEIDMLPEYIKDDYPKEYKDLKDYMLSGKTIYQHKKQLKLI